MAKAFIKIDGRELRVEVNWNAIASFLQMKGQDTFKDLAELTNLKPSDIAPMMAAAINEGERLEGHEANYTPEEIGARCSVVTVAEFVKVFQEQLNPQDSASQDDSKKE